MEAADYVVIYDISKARERRRVDQTLKGFGQRVQKSVFECRLRKRDKEELTRRIEGLGLQTGFVKIYRLEYASSSPVLGSPPATKDGPETPSAYIV